MSHPGRALLDQSRKHKGDGNTCPQDDYDRRQPAPPMTFFSRAPTKQNRFDPPGNEERFQELAVGCVGLTDAMVLEKVSL